MSANIIAAGEVAPAASTRPADATSRKGPAAQNEFRSDETERQPVEIDPEIIESAIEKTGNEVVFGGRSIEFNFDRDVGRVIVKVVAKESGEVVRQIPPDEFLKFTAQFRELIGVLFDGKA